MMPAEIPKDHRLAGAVLAGGESRRMGCDKAVLKLNGKTLLQQAVFTLTPLAQPIYVAGGNYVHPTAIPLEDSFPGLGPMAGIYSALSVANTEALLLLAVDMPLLRTATLHQLISRVGDADVAIVQTPDGQVHPLCGVYGRRCLDHLLILLKTKRLRVDRLFEEPDLRIKYVDSRELACTPMEFANVNTPDDLRLVKSLLGHT